MSRRCRQPGVPQAGFALLELLVATAIVLLLAGSLLAIATPSRQGFRIQPAAIDVQQRTRVAASSITGRLLAAGSAPGAAGLAGLPLGGVVPAILPYRIGHRRPDAPGQYHDDVLTTISALGMTAAPRLAASFQGVSGTLSLASVPGCPLDHAACGLEPGTTVLLLDASGQWDLYGVSAVLPGRVALQPRGASSGRRYNPGAWVVPVEITTHYLRPGAGPDGPQLMQYDGNESDLPQVDHVVSLSFQYFADPRPPGLRASPDPFGQVMTYGPAPPRLDEDDDRDGWGPGENCVVTVEFGRQVPRLAQLASSDRLVSLDAVALTDGPWCPDAASPVRFDADLLRIRRVRVTVRAEAWADVLRGTDSRFFRRPGRASGRPDLVPDQEVTFDVVPRTLGGGR